MDFGVGFGPAVAVERSAESPYLAHKDIISGMDTKYANAGCCFGRRRPWVGRNVRLRYTKEYMRGWGRVKRYAARTKVAPTTIKPTNKCSGAKRPCISKVHNEAGRKVKRVGAVTQIDAKAAKHVTAL